MRGGGGQSDGTQTREIKTQMEIRRTKSGIRVDHKRNKEEETELGANQLNKEEKVSMTRYFVSKRGPSASFKRLSGRRYLVDC